MKQLFIIALFLFTSIRLHATRNDVSSSELLLEKAIHSNITEEGVAYAEKAFQEAIKQNDKKTQILTLIELSKFCFIQVDYPKAEAYLTDALVLSKKIKQKNLQVLVTLERGKSFQYQGKYAEALKSFTEALAGAKKIHNKEIETRAYIYLADYFRNLTKTKQALWYIKKAMSNAAKIKLDPRLKISLYNRAAAIDLEFFGAKKTEEYSLKAIQLSEEGNFLSSKATSLNELGFFYENIESFDKALKFYNYAMEIWEKTKNKRSLENVIENCGRVYFKIGKPAKSNELLGQAAELAKMNNWYSNLSSIYYFMMKNSRSLGNENEANLYRAESLEAQIKMYQQENEKVLKELTLKYETDKKEVLLKKQTTEIQLTKEKVKAEQRNSRLIFYGLIALLILLGIVFFVAIQRSRLNKELKIKNEEVIVSNKKLEVQLNRSEVLLQEVHHRVKNNLQFISSIFELEIDSNKKLNKTESLEDMSRRIVAMSLVHELLYSQDNLEKVPVKKYIAELVMSLQEMIQSKKMNVQLTFDSDETEVDVKECIALGMILSELVSNSVKHAFKTTKKPLVEILLKYNPKENNLHLKVLDNGSGYKENELSKKGMGSRLIKIFAKQLNGKFSIQAEKHFLFSFTFSPSK